MTRSEIRIQYALGSITEPTLKLREFIYLCQLKLRPDKALPKIWYQIKSMRWLLCYYWSLKWNYPGYRAGIMKDMGAGDEILQIIKQVIYADRLHRTLGVSVKDAIKLVKWVETGKIK